MPENNKELEEALDPEKLEKEVLKEMEDEKTSKEESTKDAPKEPEEVKEEESEEETQKDPEEGKVDEEEEESKEEEEEKPKEPEEKVSRTPKTVPAWKAKIAQKKADKREATLVEENSSLQQKITELESKPDTNKDADFKAVAEETGIEVDVLKKIGSLFEQKSNPALSEKDKARIEKVETALEENKQDNLFSKEFTRDIGPQIKNLPEEKRQEIRAELNKFAFSEEYVKVPLKRIFNFEEFSKLKNTEAPKKGKKSAERSSAGVKGEIIDMDDLKGKDFLGDNQVSDKQFDTFLDKVKKGGSRYIN